MALDIFFLEDIRNAILAADETSKAAAARALDISMSDWRAGYKAALTTMALAFGLPPDIVAGDESEIRIPTEWRMEGIERR